MKRTSLILALVHVIQLSCVGDRHEGLLLVQLDVIPTVRLVLYAE